MKVIFVRGHRCTMERLRLARGYCPIAAVGQVWVLAFGPGKARALKESLSLTGKTLLARVTGLVSVKAIPGCLCAGLLALSAVSAHAAISVLDYWRLGENDPGAAPGDAATNSLDSSGPHNLTVFGPAVYTTNVAASAAVHTGSSLALNFSGAGTYASGPLLPTPAGFGLEAWVRPESTATQVIAYNGNTASNGWGIVISGSRYAGLLGGRAVLIGTTVTTNVWAHVALVRDNGGCGLFVNGNLVAQTSAPPVAPIGGFALAVAPQNLTSSSFHGTIDEVRAFAFASGQFATRDLLLSAGAPVAVTGSATNVTGTSATLNGIVNPDGLMTTFWFQWGTTTNYGFVGPLGNLGPAHTTDSVPFNLTGLNPVSIYHYRLEATNAAGASYGSDAVVLTPFVFSPVVPAGGRVLQTSRPDTISAAGQTNTYSLTLNATQVLSALVLPASGLWPIILLTDPNGAPFAAASGSAPGQNVLLESAPVLVPGTYQLSVSGVNGTTGDYVLRLLLNAGFERERYLDQPNNSLAAAEDLTPNQIPVGSQGGRQMAVVGDLSGRSSQPWPDPADFYRFFLYQGEVVSILLANQGSGAAHIKLQDGTGQLVALGATSATNVTEEIENLTASYSGYHYVAVTGDPGVQYTLVTLVGAAFGLKPSGLGTAQPLVDFLADAPTAYGSLVNLPATDADFYSVSVNAGDNLHFATTTPAAGPPELSNGLYTELRLYDQNANLVAIANGNGADGANSVIDFTVPSGGAGSWIIEVKVSESLPTSQGDYILHAYGATGYALPPIAVSITSPSSGSYVAPSETFTATFNQAIYGPSLTPGELQVNGSPAVAVALTSANSATWTIAPGSIPAGTNVANTVLLTADSLSNRVTSLIGAIVTDVFVSGAQAPDFFTSFFSSDNLTPPTAGPDQIVAQQDTLSNIPVSFLLSNDYSPLNGPLSITDVSSTTGATVVLTNSGSVVAYTPPPGLAGLDQFTYILSDGRLTATGVVTVIILSPGAPPFDELVMSGTPSNESFTFSGFPGTSYTLQSSPTVTGPWTDLYPTITAGLNGLVLYSNAVPPPTRFFRMRWLP